jgi:hypothetical protein
MSRQDDAGRSAEVGERASPSGELFPAKVDRVSGCPERALLDLTDLCEIHGWLARDLPDPRLLDGPPGLIEDGAISERIAQLDDDRQEDPDHGLKTGGPNRFPDGGRVLTVTLTGFASSTVDVPTI